MTESPEERIKILEYQVHRILPLAQLPEDVTWEERLVRLEASVRDLHERVEHLDKGCGQRINDLRKRYDAVIDRLISHIGVKP